MISSDSPILAVGMTRNPAHCPKFVVNMFKAGSGKCRDCGHEWFQHDGVIDRQVAEKFQQIWAHNQMKAAQAATAPIKTMNDVKEDKKRALIAAARHARSGSFSSREEEWLYGGGSSGRHSQHNEIPTGPTKLYDPFDDMESGSDEFKFYSKDEFMAKEQRGLSNLPTGATSTPLVRSGSASPFASSVGKNRPIKVVNLIDLTPDEDSCHHQPENASVHSGSASGRHRHLSGSLSVSSRPPLLPVGNRSPVISPHHVSDAGASEFGMKKIEEIEHQFQVMSKESMQKDTILAERNGEIERLRVQLIEATELRAKLSRVENELLSKESEWTADREKMGAMESRIEKLKSKLADQEELVESAKGESKKVLDELDRLMHENQDTVQVLKQQLVEAQQREQELLKQIGGVKADAEANDFSEEVGRLTSVVSGLEGQVLQAQQAHSQIERLETDLAAAKKEISRVKVFETSRESEIGDFQNQVESLMQQLTETKAARTAETQSLTEKIELLNAELSQTMLRESGEHHIVEELKSQVQDLTSQLTSERARVDQLQSSTADAFAVAQQQHESEITHLQQKLDNAISQLDEERRKLAMEGEVEIEKIRSLLVAAEEAKVVQETELASEKATNETLCRQLSEMASERDAIRRSATDSDSYVEQLQQQVESLQESLKQSDDAIKQLQEQMSLEKTRLSEILKNADSESDKTLVVVDALNSKVADLETQLRDSSLNASESLTKLTEAESRIQQFQEQLRASASSSQEQVDAIRNQLLQERIDAETSLRADFESKRTEWITTHSSEIERITQELTKAQAELSRVTSESGSAAQMRSERIASLQSEVDTMTSQLIATREELRSLQTELNETTDKGRTDLLKLQSESASIAQRFNDAQAELARERQSAVSVQGQLIQAQQTVEVLKAKLAQALVQAAESSKSRDNWDSLNQQNEQYLKSIQDVSFVMRTVTDKFLSPNVSEAQSRAISVEEEGSEAIYQLEKNVKAILRLIETVADKAKIIEKENLGLQDKLKEYEGLNDSLRERVNQPLIQRIMEPIMSCRWSGPPPSERFMNGNPTQRRNGEMSNIMGGAPRQYGNMTRD